MKLSTLARYSQMLRAEARAYPWKETLSRMAVDVLLVNASMVSAFTLWFLFYVVVLRNPNPQELAFRFKSFVTQYCLFWSFLALLVFQLSGFYPQTSRSGGLRKAAIAFRAVSLFMIVFVFSDYFVYRGALVPRGVALLGWLLMLLTVGGVRIVKHRVLKLYNVEQKTRPNEVKNILVLGGAGYLGSVVVGQLLARGFKVRVLDSFLFGEEPLAEARKHPSCELERGDVRDIGAVVQAMRGMDAVVHLAAIVGDQACEENKQLATEVNRASTRMLVDVARGCGVRRFVFASSCSVYGASNFMLDESSGLSPLSVYAQTKVDSETILLAAKTPEFAPTVLRLGTLFGLSSRMRFDLVVNLFVARAATAGRITVMNGDQWRPFLHVEDAGRAILACLEAAPSAVSGEIFNVGSSSSNFQIRDLGQAIARILPGTQIDVAENGDRRSYRVSFAKIEQVLGFECEISLESGMRQMLQAIRSGPLADFSVDQFNNQIAIRAIAQAAGATLSPLQQLAALARVEGRSV